MPNTSPSASPDGGWPLYTRAEVAAHSGGAARVWVTFGDGVYDVTDFLAAHPGGADKLLLAAGRSVEPFWGLYPQHLGNATVAEQMSRLRVGTLHQADAAAEAEERDAAKKTSGDGPYGREPAINAALKVHAKTPATAEPPLALLAVEHVPPAGLFYVRSHHPVPLGPTSGEAKDTETSSSPVSRPPPSDGDDKGDDERFVLTIEGAPRPLSLSVAELRSRFPRAEVVATLQCGGNRRADMNEVAPTSGIPWGPGAIGTAAWGGARLADVLASAGVPHHTAALPPAGSASSTDCSDAKRHVVFTGADGMCASVPLSRAARPNCDVLLAYDMNGAPLPPHHGGPLRIVVPGVVAVRSVKWVSRVELSPEEAEGPWQRGMAYKAFPPWMKTVSPGFDVASLPSVQETGVQSAIVSPSPGEHVPAGEPVVARGYAYAGGGRGIMRVDVSSDGGQTWVGADLDDAGKSQPPDKAWAWTLWTAVVDLPPGAKPGDTAELVVKARFFFIFFFFFFLFGFVLIMRCLNHQATDVGMNTQPERMAAAWNLRGINVNAWHRVRVAVVAPPAETEEAEA